MEDSANIYREIDFPGKRSIAIGVAAWGLYWVSTWIIQWSEVPAPYHIGVWTLLMVASIFYLLGYWKAVKGKGYPGILWLAGLTGIIGVIIIVFLPSKAANQLGDDISG